MKRILIAVLLITGTVSCRPRDIDIKLDTGYNLSASKFEFDGNHYIQFYGTGKMSVVLDPDYLSSNDTITYNGQKYTKTL